MLAHVFGGKTQRRPLRGKSKRNSGIYAGNNIAQNGVMRGITPRICKVYIMSYKTTGALVLREVKFKEADKMLTILTADEGKMSVRARGALRKTCKYSAASQLLVFSEMTLFGNKGRWSITEASTIEEFSGIRNDIERFALGSYFAQLLEAVSDEDSPNPAILSLGLNALYALSNNLHQMEKIKAAFELRLMCLSGYEPMLYGCAECGEVDITQSFMDIHAGVLKCGNCQNGQNGKIHELCVASIAAMRHVVGADPKKIFSFSLKGEASGRFFRACEEYLLAQLDSGFSSLEYWKNLH